jgi:hypothetical protein
MTQANFFSGGAGKCEVRRLLTDFKRRTDTGRSEETKERQAYSDPSLGLTFQIAHFVSSLYGTPFWLRLSVFKTESSLDHSSSPI